MSETQSIQIIQQFVFEMASHSHQEQFYRIDLESGGYAAGLEVGKKWRETNQPIQ